MCIRDREYIDNRRLNIPVDRTDETWGAENNNHFSAGKFRYNPVSYTHLVILGCGSVCVQGL